MKGSLPLGRLAGIAVFVHITFFLLPLLIGFAEWKATRSYVEVAFTILFVFVLFGCVVLHELGHALAARRYGIKTRDITLLPIGGVARLERMPDKPSQELVVALAGPAVNVVIAAMLGVILFAGFGWRPTSETLVEMPGRSKSFLLMLAQVNLGLVLFNMLPAFPMDGGRVVRALLAMMMPHAKATAAAAVIGKGMAILFALEAFQINVIPFIQGNQFLLLIAVMVWFGAGMEARAADMRENIKGIAVADVMMRDFRTLSPDATVAESAEISRRIGQKDFPVAENGDVVGMLRWKDMQSAADAGKLQEPVREIMSRDIVTINSSDMLDDIFNAFLASGYDVIPVENQGRLVGLLPLERLARISRPAPAAPTDMANSTRA